MSIHKFGRIEPPVDARDYNFLARAVMPQVAQIAPREAKPTPRKRAYNLGPLLDQGDFPHCCGYAAKGFLDAAPIMSKPDAPPGAVAIYNLAQDLDEWPGNNYDGTSGRGTVKALQSFGVVKSYAWAVTVDEAITWTNGGFGTGLAGTHWYAEMSDVDKNGFMVEPSSLSTPLGGHEWHFIWYDAKKDGILMRNSWGEEFGIVVRGRATGLAYMRRPFFARLLREHGDCVLPTQIKVAKPQ